MISPVVAGGGRWRLFADDGPPRTFELVEATPTSSGTVIATYRPAGVIVEPPPRGPGSEQRH